MAVMIGVDPHKATHTAVAIDPLESEVRRVRVRATRRQVPQLLASAGPSGERTWAIEPAGGMGYLLAQRGAAHRGRPVPMSSTVLFIIAAVIFVVALILLFTGSWVWGIILLIVAALVGPGGYSIFRRRSPRSVASAARVRPPPITGGTRSGPRR